jgi:hypothetical protein
MSSLWGYIFGANEKKVSAYVIDDLPAKPQDTLSVEDFEPSSEDEWYIVGETDSVSSTDNIVAFVPTLDSRHREENETPTQSLRASTSSILVFEDDDPEHAVALIAEQRQIMELLGQDSRPQWKQSKSVIVKQAELKREKKRKDKMVKQPQARSARQLNNQFKMHWNYPRAHAAVSRKQQKSF